MRDGHLLQDVVTHRYIHHPGVYTHIHTDVHTHARIPDMHAATHVQNAATVADTSTAAASREEEVVVVLLLLLVEAAVVVSAGVL